MQKTSDINVVETRALPSPAALLAELPKTEIQSEFVGELLSDADRHLPAVRRVHVVLDENWGRRS